MNEIFMNEIRKCAGMLDAAEGSSVKGMQAKKQDGGWVLKIKMADGSTRTVRNAHNLVAGASKE
jgi:hypothetical protein